jgi:diguanylate cyclase (GGDEF)-like protein/PAS domain S-box-containing protein
MRERVHGWLALKPVWLTVCALPVFVLLALAALNLRHSQDRAAAFERENMQIRLKQLAREVAEQPRQLAELARELAQSEQIIELLQDTAAAPLDRSAVLGFTRRGVDGLLVVSDSQVVRLSTRTAGGHLLDEPPDPAMMRFLASVTAGIPATDDGSAHAADLPVFAGHQWMVARPILSKNSPVSILGWVVAARSIAEPLIAEPAASVGASPAAAGDTPMSSSIIAGLCVLAAIIFAALMASTRRADRPKSPDARFKAIIDQANDGIVIVDAATQELLYTNAAFLGRLGYTKDEAQTLTLRDILADGPATAESILARLRASNSQMAMNMQQRCKNGSLIDTEVRCNAVDTDGGDVLALVTHDVSLRRKAEQQLIENQHRLDRMAHHDQLTGLPNRHYLTAFLPEAIAEALASGTMLGVVFLDLDRFKHINDTRGHETGDKLLQEVAARLQAVVRDSDVVIRMGGDEFVVVFRNVKSYDEVTLGAGRIIETLNRPIIIEQHSLQTTGSVGVSLFPRDGSTMVELLKHSDTAMYQAKDRGRNNVQMFSQIMNRKIKHRVAVEASLREALRLKQLDVHYQPFINLLTRKVVGLEALMRWRHPVDGMVPADQFIPVAEETGLIVPMGNFVLHRTLQNMSAWRKAGVPLVPMSLNIAPAQLQRGELQSTIATLLKTHGFRPEMLQLEMTERAMFDSQAGTGENRQDTLARLRDLGVKIAIDDFGTGYSSLSYLKHWRVDALKIDRSFVRDLATDSSDLAIVSAIIAIARHLQIQVIAEGIEAYQQAEILRRLGCAVGQGFLFAPPMTAEKCLELLGDNAEPDKAEDEDMLAEFSAGRG